MNLPGTDVAVGTLDVALSGAIYAAYSTCANEAGM
jgi:hypothetical protein